MYAKFAKNMDDCSQPILSLILLYKPCVCTLLSFFVVELLALAVVGLGIYLNYTKDGTLPCYLAPTANAAASASKLQRVKTNSKVVFFFLHTYSYYFTWFFLRNVRSIIILLSKYKTANPNFQKLFYQLQKVLISRSFIWGCFNEKSNRIGWKNSGKFGMGCSNRRVWK